MFDVFFLKLVGNDLESNLFKPRHDADLVNVKKRMVIWAAVAMAVLIGVLVIVFVSERERVSLTLLHYRRWPHGATLKLSNDSRRTITYLTDQGGGITLFLQKTPDGWTNAPIPITSTMGWDNFDGQSTTISHYVFTIPAMSGPTDFLRSRELKPGQSAEVYAGLEPDGLPVRAGVVCCVPQGAVAQRLGQWIGRVKQWRHVKSTPPGQIEVWCSEPLQVSEKPTRAAGE
jgi:hypothetical protein